ncbi:uncharacterized protein LOC127881677 [Dreissena polymorpha]|uniref:Chitin-binding type-2 domain-containing protein n=1 Tax=Dreissena polymorpha TaxID=45954 RepID=A0A9D4JTS3_DREPO|nr:uncharacterized protein LOC127881677 [Dreissena polymorpha]KAH3819937.1 hypothetical protein DPMN_121681 [Dreissena polymorpha]
MPYEYTCISVFLSVAVLISAAFANNLQCNTNGDYQIIPKADCMGFYICVWGSPVEMPPCPAGTRFSATVNACVHKGSDLDDCIPDSGVTATPVTTTGPLSVEERCAMFGGIIAHPTECQAYYNCSVWYQYIPRLLEQHMVECPYPQLFNADSEQCEHFENVTCGSRKEFKGACDYRQNQCAAAHCIPCNVRFGNCVGKLDGLAPHEAKLWSPFYVVCYKERAVEHNRCPQDAGGRTQLFHPVLIQCVPLEMIPQKYGGSMPA